MCWTKPEVANHCQFTAPNWLMETWTICTDLFYSSSSFGTKTIFNESWNMRKDEEKGNPVTLHEKYFLSWTPFPAEY